MCSFPQSEPLRIAYGGQSLAPAVTSSGPAHHSLGIQASPPLLSRKKDYHQVERDDLKEQPGAVSVGTSALRASSKLHTHH